MRQRKVAIPLHSEFHVNLFRKIPKRHSVIGEQLIRILNITIMIIYLPRTQALLANKKY
jgi:hypothetical protein